MKLRRIGKRVFGRRLIYTMLLIALQAFILFYAVSEASIFTPVQIGFMAASVFVAFWLMKKYENPAYKMSWVIIILILPVFGVLLFLLFGNKAAGRPIIKQLEESTYRGETTAIAQPKKDADALAAESLSAARTAQYLYSTTGMPVYQNTQTEYLPSGEAYFARLKQELEKAQRFIFIEMFIIQEGEMWNAILDILYEKARSGVDVRVLYDDLGCIKTLPRDYHHYLKSIGIDCAVFNPMVPLLSIRHNNRDHRKIIVIDGEVGFTGGINFADEYINKTPRFGHWVDCGIMLRGRAVRSMTVTFLATWDFLRKQKTDDAGKYFGRCDDPDAPGWCIPYSENPYTRGDVAMNVYLNMINKAENYLYIATPYLVLDFTLHQALCTAAQSGVDVRILFPGIPDKKLTYLLGQDYFPTLIAAGVKIYLYTPGFVHSKLMVSDDKTAVVGTINLDFRSLFLHFENAVWMYRTPAVCDIKQDFLKRLPQCHLVNETDLKNDPWYKKVVRTVVSPFGPLL